jgi:hypothetical protein
MATTSGIRKRKKKNEQTNEAMASPLFLTMPGGA